MMFNSTRKCKTCKKDIAVHLDDLVKVNSRDGKVKRGYYHLGCFPSGTALCPDCSKRLSRASFSNVNCFVCRNSKCRSFWKK